MKNILIALTFVASLAGAVAPASALPVAEYSADLGVLHQGENTFRETVSGLGSFVYNISFTLDSTSAIEIEMDKVLRIRGNDSFHFNLFDSSNSLLGSANKNDEIDLHLASGDYLLAVYGDVRGASQNKTGFFEGAIEVSPVPEPDTWGLLLVGLGLIGFQLRSRSRIIAK